MEIIKSQHRRTPEQQAQVVEKLRLIRRENPTHSQTFFYNGQSFQGSYEPRFAQKCDQLSLDWRKFDRKLDVCVDYTRLNGRASHYGPDFVVEGRIVEVKGYVNEDEKHKWKCWRESGRELFVVTGPLLCEFEGLTSLEQVEDFFTLSCTLF